MEGLSAKELEVLEVLTNLHVLARRESGQVTGDRRWGKRRKRSRRHPVADPPAAAGSSLRMKRKAEAEEEPIKSSLFATDGPSSSQPPAPPLPPAAAGAPQRRKRKAEAVEEPILLAPLGGKRTRVAEEEEPIKSPCTPLSFSASDGPSSSQPPAPPLPPPSPLVAAETRTVFPLPSGEGRLAEMRRRLEALSSDNANLQQCVGEFRSVFQSLKWKNSSLKLLRSELLQGPGDDAAAAAAAQPPAAARPSNVDLILSIGTTSGNNHTHSRRPRLATSDAERADLYARLIEETAAQAAAMRAAVSAGARRRRLEIKREKSNGHSFAGSPRKRVRHRPPLPPAQMN